MQTQIAAPTKNFQFIGDRLEATYFHETSLVDQRIREPLRGYSKHKHHAEPLNKSKLLLDYISRIIHAGYNIKGYYTAFYTNSLAGTDANKLLVELTPTKFQVHAPASFDEPLCRMLEELYRLYVVDGKPHWDKLPTKAPRQISKDIGSDDFSFKSERHRTLDDLVAHCRKLRESGYPLGRIEGYYYSYKNAHFDA